MKHSVFLLLAALLAAPVSADEGIWLPNQFPSARVKEKYGFDPTPAFLEKVQRAAVRLNNGGSGSFVSPRGLLFTNHHVASDCIQKLSSTGADYMKDGFSTDGEAGERQCPDLEVNVLQSIEDVTNRVKKNADDEMEATAMNRQRKANMSEIEKECGSKTGLRCDVVTLYSGGRYHLYRYKKYTDVRLVFAPEFAIAAFGGDPDNFTFPRYCLDISFLRVYENGKPLSTPNYLAWSKTGVRDGELTFVAGHPGTTGRLATLAELEYSRDVSYPLFATHVQELIHDIQEYQKRGIEQKRIAADELFSQQNTFKAFSGFLRGLRDPELMARKRDEEKTLQASVIADPARREKYGRTWEEVRAAYRLYAAIYKELWIVDRGAGRASSLFTIAKDITRYAEEKTKPNAQRLREYTDARLPAVEQQMFSAAPIYPDFEEVLIGWYLNALRKDLGAENPMVRKILAGREPAEAAKAYVAGTKLADVAERRRLASGVEAVRASDDSMMVLVRLLEPRARELRKQYEDTIESVTTSAASRIAQIRFAASGSDDYPDATFTLRISYGPVLGYTNADGKAVSWSTNFTGLYRRATGSEPFGLPERWVTAKNRIKLTTPYDFVTTCDTHGGNSGSPTINTKGEVIGILFDGNLEGLPNRFVYRDQKGERSVHVASQGIVEALRKVYNAKALLTELGQ